ncbi:MAG: NAD(P)H-binding protein [Betaproteobacteria bacterium]
MLINSLTSMKQRVFVLGASGTIGQATVQALVAAGHEVVCFLRRPSGSTGAGTRPAAALDGAMLRYGRVSDAASLARDGFQGERFDVLLSCMASRTGAPKDAWAIDHQAHVQALTAARQAGVEQMILLSAICVQKPLLAFQQAKLAFEQTLIDSGMNYSIVRPTAFFKSLSGQLERLRRGKPFLMFGDGSLTACKPISDADLADFLVSCMSDPSRHRKILPVGGPGPALTAHEQGELLFKALGQAPKFRQVPVALLDTIIAALGLAGKLLPALKDKAELARIGRYYATESMLVWDPLRGRYDADATPSYGRQTLQDFYADLVAGRVAIDRGDHAVF